MMLEDLEVIVKALLDYGYFNENFILGNPEQAKKALKAMCAVQDIIRSMEHRQRVMIEVRKPLEADSFHGELTHGNI